LAYVINQAQCINCGWCRRVCPTETIFYFDSENRKHRVEPDGCIDCDICAQVCPMNCITHNPEMLPTSELLEAAKAKARRWAGDQRMLKVGLRTYAADQVARLTS
jgi:ferredoxin